MFFDDEILPLRKKAVLKQLPPIPVTGWRAPSEFPRLTEAAALSLDVETFDPELLTAGPGWARGRGHIVGVSLGAIDKAGNAAAWYFPIRHTVCPEQNLSINNVLSYVKFQLETNKPKVGANLLYDIGWLSEEGIDVKGKLFDVQFAEALIDETARVALDVLGQKYLNEGKETNLLYDWIRQAYSPNESELRADIYRSPPCLVGKYAEADALLPLRIIKEQWKELASQELTDLFRLECDLIPILIKMRRAGVSVDVELAHRMKVELEAETKELYKQIKTEYDYTLDSTSNANIAKFFDAQGVKYNFSENGKGSFEKEWLETLEHPAGKLLNNIRHHEKICSTFLQKYIIDKNVDGKLYPQFHPLKGDRNGTLVGRFASSDPNLQNIPARTKLGKRVRTCFIPDKGHIGWRKHDYSQIHYRLLAHYACDKGDGSADALRLRYSNNPATDYHMDVYYNVAPLLGWSLTDKEEIAIKRRPVKNVNFGLLYGQTNTALAHTAGFSQAQAKQFFDAYHKAAPYVRATMDAIGLEVQEFGFVRTLLGRRVRFNLWEPVFERKQFPLPYNQAIRQYGSNIKRAYEYRGVNYKFQGSEPDIMKTALRDCDNSGVFDYTGYPRLTVHDELDWSKIDDSPQMNEAFTFIQRTMENAIRLRIPVKVDATQGPNWGKVD